MAYSKILKSISIAMLLGLFSGSAPAVDLLEVESSFRFSAIEHNSHWLCVDINWSHGVEEEPLFDLQASSAVESCVWSNWIGHFDAGGFRFSGEILPNPEAWPYGWYLELESQISVLLEVTFPTMISASRAVEGIFSGSRHSVTITYPGGLNVILLGEDSGLNSASELLDPGIYRITFSVNTNASPVPPFAYTGFVEVNWNGTVGTDTETWDSMKSLFR